MALAPLAPVSALESRLGLEVGSLTGTDLQQALDNLADASALVRSAAGVPFVDANGEPDAPEDVFVVVVRAAIRGYRNPEGLFQESISGAYSSTVPQGETGVYLTSAETAIVKAAGSASSTVRRVGSIATPSAYGVRPYRGTLYAPVDTGGRPLPWEAL